MAMNYELELLSRGKAFRAALAEQNPDHSDFTFIDADIAARKARIDLLNALHLTSSEGAQRAQTEAASKGDLRQETYDRLFLLVEPTADEKEALGVNRGLVFLPITLQSYAQVVAEDPGHFWDQELEYANARPALRDFVPPVAVEAGLIETELALPESFRKPRATALEMIEEYSQELQTEFPDFRAIMLPATGYASADRAYSQRNPGRVLFKNYFAWCLDNLSEVDAAFAGRNGPAEQFNVVDWFAGLGNDDVWAVPAVVKIGSK